MKVAVFSCKPYDKRTLASATNDADLSMTYFESRLSMETISLVKGFDAVSCFVNDDVNADVIRLLKQQGVKTIALRCAGFNNVDLEAAKAEGIKVFHVPDYSPTSVAEHAVALIMTLNRKTHRAYHRVKEGNFALEGLMGFNLAGKTVGCIGTGRIGTAFCRIMKGFGCEVLCYDLSPSQELIDQGCQYIPLDELYQQSDIISLHCPLNTSTHHLISKNSLAKMKDGVMIINTSRGALVHAQEAIDALYSGKIGYLGLDVYEQENKIFFEDMSSHIIQDSVFQLMLTFPNVVVTGHQGYFTIEALNHIAQTTVDNLLHHQSDSSGTRQLA
ncbi:2-hydroxyacid dehydrogenase [Marinomonas sp. M1K-6]|uniref:2-hydroxyacid dehydrogenase n=1 Tax=Marinomonas profundi TaxID=2726122 RepID=A0A847R356_9GAMM|nr:2-hydroxyacid dehydrogenase [Marinomonas profundi]NLQ18341.1 2-hydroxyacid dehydrogenase [Marinomonas profundi]UDV02403.1 2-hydroxyacid dehydrogenase [Marinomonas profundi]